MNAPEVKIDGEALEDARSVEVGLPPPDERTLNRAHASALFEGMPEWWKVKFEAVFRQYGACRKSRRAVAKLLRDYDAWGRTLARTKKAHADDRERRFDTIDSMVLDRIGGSYPRPVAVGTIAESIARLVSNKVISRETGEQELARLSPGELAAEA